MVITYDSHAALFITASAMKLTEIQVTKYCITFWFCSQLNSHSCHVTSSICFPLIFPAKEKTA